MGKLGKVVVLVFLISSLGMVNLPSATADGVVDQSNVPGVSNLIQPIPLPSAISQSFTPTQPDITAINIFLQAGDAGTRLDILIQDNGAAVILGEPNFNPNCPCNFGAPVHVDFTSTQTGPLTISALNEIFISQSASSTGPTISWGGTVSVDIYPTGSATCSACSAGDDFFFETFEGPSVAVGSISIPIDTTSMLVAGSEMNSVWITLAIAAAIGVGILIIRRNYFSAE